MSHCNSPVCDDRIGDEPGHKLVLRSCGGVVLHLLELRMPTGAKAEDESGFGDNGYDVLAVGGLVVEGASRIGASRGASVECGIDDGLSGGVADGAIEIVVRVKEAPRRIGARYGIGTEEADGCLRERCVAIGVEETTVA